MTDKFFNRGRNIFQRTEGEPLLLGTMHDTVVAITFVEAMNNRAVRAENLDEYDKLVAESYQLAGHNTSHGIGKVAPHRERLEQAQKLKYARMRVLGRGLNNA